MDKVYKNTALWIMLILLVALLSISIDKNIILGIIISSVFATIVLFILIKKTEFQP